MANTKERFRNWSFLQYEDSAPANWRESLSALMVPWIESPLHDADVNADGSAKKPHRHIVMSFPTMKSLNQVQEISNLVSGVLPVPVQSMIGMIRYLGHLDNPDKVQYSISDCVSYCGFDPDKYLQMAGRDKRIILREMMDYIMVNEIDSFAEFALYCSADRFDDWFPVITDKNTLFLKEFIKSYAYKHYKRDSAGNLVTDPETGELVCDGEFFTRRLK